MKEVWQKQERHTSFSIPPIPGTNPQNIKKTIKNLQLSDILLIFANE